MLWGQQINVYTYHKNLTRDGLGLTSDRVARWRILLEEYAPEIIYIKGIHNTVANAISRLDYDPKHNRTNEYNHATHVKSTKVVSNHRWMMFSKLWSCFNKTQDPDELNPIEMNHVFTNRSEGWNLPSNSERNRRSPKSWPGSQTPLLEQCCSKQRTRTSTCWKRKLHMPWRKARNTKAIATVCDDMVSPLSSAPRAYPSRRDNESCNILERSAYHHSIHNEVMQDLPSK